jgi:hypothetical protein
MNLVTMPVKKNCESIYVPYGRRSMDIKILNFMFQIPGSAHPEILNHEFETWN